MRSDRMKKGIDRAPHRSLFSAMGYLSEELERPIIGIASSANEVIPGHIHLGKIAQAVKDGVRMAGGTPMEFSTIGICDGIAMNHEGMKYSLGSTGTCLLILSKLWQRHILLTDLSSSLIATRSFPV